MAAPRPASGSTGDNGPQGFALAIVAVSMSARRRDRHRQVIKRFDDVHESGDQGEYRRRIETEGLGRTHRINRSACGEWNNS
ncbi:MAG: hypothetical protein HY066_02700 [Betaproteobacteria bacterium]|nr:hypothetical protein [Betaproteobacteria bacterium]